MSAASASPYGFKEWSLVCAALGSGAQSIILRKGGIHEGKAGFWWRHDHFFLFPTHFHEQTLQFPWTPPGAVALTADPDGQHRIKYFAEVVTKHQITDWETVLRLKELHFWTESTLRGRFDYSESTGISLAFLRLHRLEKPWVFPDEKKFGGCRSWLDLPAVPEPIVLTPVLDQAQHAARAEALASALGLS
jgi:hypothetical protein